MKTSSVGSNTTRKSSSKPASSNRANSLKRSQSSAPNNSSKKNVQNSEKSQKAQADRTSKSAELKDLENSTKAGKADEPKDSDKNSPEESKATDAEKDALKQQLEDLKKELEDLKSAKQAEDASNQGKCQGGGGGGKSGGGSCGGGGGCGKGQGAPQAGAAQAINGNANDPDSQLQQMARQILAAGQTSQPTFGVPFAQANGSNGNATTGINGALGSNSVTPNGGGDVNALKSALKEKVQQLKSQGFQPRPETRALVTQALGQDPFGEAQQNAGQQTTNSFSLR